MVKRSGIFWHKLAESDTPCPWNKRNKFRSFCYNVTCASPVRRGRSDITEYGDVGLTLTAKFCFSNFLADEMYICTTSCVTV